MSLAYNSVATKIAILKRSFKVEHKRRTSWQPWYQDFIGFGRPAFDRHFVDLSCRGTATAANQNDQSVNYDGDAGVTLWLQQTRNLTYTPFLDCLTATHANLVSDEFNQLLTHARPQRLVDLGVGGGEKASAFMHRLTRSTVRRVALIDSSSGMLRHTYANVDATNVRSHFEMDLVHADFVKDFEAIARSSWNPAASEGTTIYVMLGSTFSNLPEHDTALVFANGMKPNDALILGVELRRRSDGAEQAADKLVRPYHNDQFRAFGVLAGQRATGLGADFSGEVNIRLDLSGAFSQIPGSWSVIGEVDVGARDLLGFQRSNRYDEDAFINEIESAGFAHLYTVESPRNGFYRHYCFIRQWPSASKKSRLTSL